MRNVVFFPVRALCSKRKTYMQFYLRLTLAILTFLCILSIYTYVPRESVDFLLLNDAKQASNHDEYSKRVTRQVSVDEEGKSSNYQTETMQNQPILHLAIVACGERLEEPLMMMKSAVIMGRRDLHFHVFADDNLRLKFNESLVRWREVVTWRKLTFSLYAIQFPSEHAAEWKRLFKLCAAQRLFIPELLQNLDALLYVDTDVLFLRPVEDVWSHFALFNSSQIAALAPETEDASTNWYTRFARHPFYKPLGVNSGVMLMNLTRMRQFKWHAYLYPILNKYRYNITWGDQDIINILFFQYPDKLYIYGCEWNYRPDHCMYTSTCKKAEIDGVSVLHGSRGYFHTDKQPAFKAVYDAIKLYKLGSDIVEHLIKPLESKLKVISDTNCGKVYRSFLKQLEFYAVNSSSSATSFT